MNPTKDQQELLDNASDLLSKKQHHDEGTPVIRKAGNAIKVTIFGQSWTVGADRVMVLIRNRQGKEKRNYHYMSDQEWETKKGINLQHKWVKMRRYFLQRYGLEGEQGMQEEIEKYAKYRLKYLKSKAKMEGETAIRV